MLDLTCELSASLNRSRDKADIILKNILDMKKSTDVVKRRCCARGSRRNYGGSKREDLSQISWTM